MRRGLLLSFFMLLTVTAFAQRIGEWMVYPAFGNPSVLFDTGKKVYAIGSGSLMSYEKEDESIMLHSKIDGLNDADIAHMGYDRKNDLLILIYSNQNIDIVSDGSVYNIPDFKEKSMTTPKTVNNVLVSDGKAYLATDFGGLVVDLIKKEIVDTYNFGSMKATAFFPAYGHLCMITGQGLLACPDEKNGYDFSNWKLVVDGSLRNEVAFWEESVCLIGNDAYVYKLRDDWNLDRLIHSEPFDHVKSDNGRLFCYSGNRVVIYEEGKGYHSRVDNLTGVNDVSSGRSSELWLATDADIKELRLQGNTWVMANEGIVPDAPVIKDPYDIDIREGYVYMVTGGPFRMNDYTPGAVSILKDGSWTNITERYLNDNYQTSFFNLNDIKASPFEPDRFFVGSHARGLFEFKGKELVKRHTREDNALTSAFEDPNGDHFWASSLSFDGIGNLWVVNAVVDNALRLKTPDNKWYNYTIPKLGQVGGLYPMMVTRNNRQKWFMSYYTKLTLNVYDDNNTPLDKSDDQAVCYNSLVDQDGNTHNLIAFRDMVEDLDGKIWIATSIGPMVISNPSNIFKSNACIRPKIARNDGTGLADYLMDNTYMIAIEVDAANRKWIGTSGNGVYLLSADGMEVIHHFTTDNSPLYSNEILSMKIDDATGKVYIGCMGGLICFQSDAIEGKEDYDNVYAYPNPVRPDFTGPVVVTGLRSNTLIKVTDINNNLIYQGYSLGGQFSWDGLNKKGERIKSGIYLVYGTSEDGKQGVVTKIMFIN